MSVWNSSLSSGSKHFQRLKEEIYSLKSEMKEKYDSLNRLVENVEALLERAAEAVLLDVQSPGENQCSVDKEGIQHYNLILNPINPNVVLQHVEDVHKGNTYDTGALCQKIDTAKEEKTERQEKNQESRNAQEETNDEDYGSTDLDSHQPPVDPARKHESGTESDNFCFNDIREEDDDANDHSSDEVVNDNIVPLLSFENMKEALPTENLKGLLEEGIKRATEIKNVVQHNDGTENPLMKNIQSWIDAYSTTKGTGESIITLLKELCNLMSSMRNDKGSSDKRQWFLNWSNDRLPPRDYNCIVFAMPFNVSFRIVPLPPRSFIAQNNDMYQYEYIRIASFSTYRGRGFGVVFAQAGFVFDPARNMVVCPWCNVFVDNNVNIINMHLPGCVILHINIPFHNPPSALVPAANGRAFRQVGGLNLSSAPVQTPNRQSIGRSCSRIRSERTLALPFIVKKGVRSQEHAMRGSTEPSNSLNSHQVTPLVAIGRTNQTDSLKHEILSASTSNGTGKSSACSVHSCTRRNCTSTTDVTGSFNQCHQSASDQNAIIPSRSSKRADYSTDLAHVVFSEPSSSGNGNTWEPTRDGSGENGSEVAANAENKEIEEISTLTRGAVGVVAASNTYFCQEEIHKYLLTDAAQAVLDMGYQTKVVLRAIERVLLKRGCEKLTGKSIMEAVLDMEDDDDMAKSQQLPSSFHTNTRNQGDEAVGRTLSNGSSSNSIMNTKRITMCKICLDNKVGLGFLPCCQLLICQDCSSMHRKCPICKTLISGP